MHTIDCIYMNFVPINIVAVYISHRQGLYRRQQLASLQLKVLDSKDVKTCRAEEIFRRFGGT